MLSLRFTIPSPVSAFQPMRNEFGRVLGYQAAMSVSAVSENPTCF